MPRDVSDLTLNEVYSMETGMVFLDIVKISHSELVEDIYLVNNNEDIEFEAVTYKASYFKFRLPQEIDGEVNTATLTMGNVDRQLIPALRTIQTPLTISMSTILVNTLTGDITREIGEYVFDLMQVSYNVDTITGTLVYDFKTQQSMGSIRINYNNFPGLQKA